MDRRVLRASPYALKGPHNMPLTITQNEIDSLWVEGFRPLEIYVYNDSIVEYCGDWHEAGTISGWVIEHVFASKESIKTYPFFDVIIGLSSMYECGVVWE
tara:strand:+ start:213 stop:512 length:300 start_codon:yes stop_codon:yes gene_type:complete